MTTNKPWDIVATEWLIAFPSLITAKQLGLKPWDLFVCLMDCYFKKWEVLELLDCKGLESNIYNLSNWKKKFYTYLHRIAPQKK